MIATQDHQKMKSLTRQSMVFALLDVNFHDYYNASALTPTQTQTMERDIHYLSADEAMDYGQIFQIKI